MKRLLKIVVFVYFAMSLLGVGAVSLGRAQSETEVLPELGRCGDVPCYMGVTLNSTTIEEAGRIFTAKPEITSSTLFGPTRFDIAKGVVKHIATFLNDDNTIKEFDLTLSLLPVRKF